MGTKGCGVLVGLARILVVVSVEVKIGIAMVSGGAQREARESPIVTLKGGGSFEC